MYKIMNEGKIIGISEGNPTLLDDYKVVRDSKHTCDDYEEYNGEYLLKKDVPLPTKEEQSEKRAYAYQQEVDTITCHIQRLSDEEQTPEIVQEIEDLKNERSAKVEEIKERYPYPEGV